MQVSSMDHRLTGSSENEGPASPSWSAVFLEFSEPCISDWRNPSTLWVSLPIFLLSVHRVSQHQTSAQPFGLPKGLSAGQRKCIFSDLYGIKDSFRCLCYPDEKEWRTFAMEKVVWQQLRSVEICGGNEENQTKRKKSESITFPPPLGQYFPPQRHHLAFFSFFFNISNQFSTSPWLLTGISEVLRQRGGFGKGADLQQLLLNRHMGSSLCPFPVSNCIVLLLLPKGCTLHYMEIYSRAQINGHECFYYL